MKIGVNKILFICVLISIKVRAVANINGDKPLINDTIVKVLHKYKDEKWYTGAIDGKYKITLYLRFFKTSMEHLNIYSVTGFYYYNSVKKKIPLVGIYDGHLVLYKFSPKSKSDSLILNFENYGSCGFWDEIETYKELKGYEEKFIIGNKGKVTWQSKTKTLPLEIYATELSVISSKEYLLIKALNKKISTESLGLDGSGFSVINATWQNNKLKVMLNYSHGSRGFVMGMCGAGIEVGYYILEFDSGITLLSKQHLQTESCLDGIYTEQEKTSEHGIEKWRITYRDSAGNYMVDFKKMSFLPVKEK